MVGYVELFYVCGFRQVESMSIALFGHSVQFEFGCEWPKYKFSVIAHVLGVLKF